MTATVQYIASEVQRLPAAEFDEFLDWLAAYELEHDDDWDRRIREDSGPGGRLASAMARARVDLSAGRATPLHGLLDHA